MKKLLILIIILSSCNTPYLVTEPSGYLVTVETQKPKNIEVLKLQQTSCVDSVVNQNFGFAIKGFASDSMFKVSPYYRIETLNKTVYSEAKRKRKFKNYNR